MRHITSSIVRRVAGAVAIAMLLAGCAERPREAARSTLTAPTTVLRSASGIPLALACPAMAGIMKRGVAAGTRGDANNNGVVCDQRVGVPGHERVLTTDDVLMPSAAVRQ